MSDSSLLQTASSQWAILRAGAGEAEGQDVPSLRLNAATSKGQALRLAVGPRGEPRLLLPLEAHERYAGAEPGGALTMQVVSLALGGRTHRFLDLMCNSVDLETVFGEVVDEIVARVSDGVGCINATQATLEDFRTLLSAKAPDQIDRNRIVGLVGELIVLNRLLDITPSAWRAWRGPGGDRHDFRNGQVSLEVKASLRSGSAIYIHGLEQLEVPSGGELRLIHFVLEPVAGGLLSVAGLGERALSRADDPSALRELLSSMGCQDVRSSEWNSEAFRFERESLYRVDQSFPRIVPSAFIERSSLAGISEVCYQIDLSCALASKRPGDEVQLLVEALAR